MSKNLYLMRHSFAESVFVSADFDRSLVEEGYVAIRKLVEKLVNNPIEIDTIICSPAKRTKQTAVKLTELLDISQEFIRYHEKIYNASVRELLELTNSIEEEFQNVMIVGHNPAISFFAEYLTGEEIGTVVPSGLVKVKLEKFKWEEVSQGIGEFIFYYSKHINNE